MKIIQSFIKPQYEDLIEKTLCGYDFDWHFNNSSVDYENLTPNTFFDSKTADTYQFTHLFVAENKIISKYWQMIAPLIFHITASEGIDTNHVERCKANLTTKQSNVLQDFYFPAHFDTDANNKQKVITAIYYVNDSDGDTILFETPALTNVDELKIVNRVKPKKGTLIYFDSNTLHAGQLPQEHTNRCIINFNFLQNSG